MTFKHTAGPTITTRRVVGINGHTLYSAACYRGAGLGATFRARVCMDYALGDEENHLAVAEELLQRRGLKWSIVASGWTKEGMVFVCQ